MMLEFGVLAACAGGYCPQVGAAYFSQYPEIRQQLKNAEKQMIQMTPEAVKLISPVVGLVFTKESVVRLNENNSMSINISEPAIKFIWNF